MFLFKPLPALSSAVLSKLRSCVSMVTCSTLGWEVPVPLSWRQGYSVVTYCVQMTYSVCVHVTFKLSLCPCSEHRVCVRVRRRVSLSDLVFSKLSVFAEEVVFTLLYLQRLVSHALSKTLQVHVHVHKSKEFWSGLLHGNVEDLILFHSTARPSLLAVMFWSFRPFYWV